jgi:hypothetical protein
LKGIVEVNAIRLKVRIWTFFFYYPKDLPSQPKLI